MGRKKPIAVPYGERDGVLLHVSETERGLRCNCICPMCYGVLVARKGSKTSHHFAHYRQANCSPESLLHHLGKRLLYRRITLALSHSKSLPMKWSCSYCHDEHEEDLVKLAAGVKMETSLGPCRPDITIFDSVGSAVAVVEVVVSHRPDENVRAFASKIGVPVVEFHIDVPDDLEDVGGSGVLRPTTVNYCIRPKCKKCGRPLSRKALHVVTGPCWRCGAPMKIAMLDVEGLCVGPEDFAQEEIDLAREHGATLMENYSRTVDSRYVANTCPTCRAFIGAFYLHDYWDEMTPETAYPAGEICLDCEGQRVVCPP